MGALRVLEAIRILKMEKTCKFYQASSSELYGLVKNTPQNEDTQFYPRSPYAVSKLFAYWICVNYREAYDILHVMEFCLITNLQEEGNIVSRKISRGLSRVMLGLDDCLYLGNLDAKETGVMQKIMLKCNG